MPKQEIIEMIWPSEFREVKVNGETLWQDIDGVFYLPFEENDPYLYQVEIVFKVHKIKHLNKDS